MRCARDSDWCDGIICVERGIDCPNSDYQRGKALIEKLRPYVEPRAFVTTMLQIGVPVHTDESIPEGEPWCNPDRAEIRIHPADRSALLFYTEIERA